MQHASYQPAVAHYFNGQLQTTTKLFPCATGAFFFLFLQAAEAASKLVGLTVDYVISSPFKRCLQTSAGLVRNLQGLQDGHWLVDWQLGEVRGGVKEA
jgi:hypothetical protein